MRLLPLGTGNAEQRADDRSHERLGEVRDQIDPVGAERIGQVVGDPYHGVAEPVDARPVQRLLPDRSQVRVLLDVGLDDVGAHRVRVREDGGDLRLLQLHVQRVEYRDEKRSGSAATLRTVSYRVTSHASRSGW